MWKLKNLLLDVLALAAVKFFLGGYIALKKTFLQEFPELQGNPEIGKWYEVAPEGTVSAKGSPYQIYKMFSGFLHYLLIISLEMSDEPKKCILGETSSHFILQSLGLRFPMYIHAPLNLKIKPSFS